MAIQHHSFIVLFLAMTVSPCVKSTNIGYNVSWSKVYKDVNVTGTCEDRYRQIQNYSTHISQSNRGRPGDHQLGAVWQFGFMILCKLGRNPFDYNDYGCFCGPGHTGNRPVDGVDSCCQRHDSCYDDFAKICPDFNSYLGRYKWKGCCSGALSCVSTGDCPRALCQCDVDFVNCLAKEPYKKKFHFGIHKYLPSWTSRKSALFHRLCRNYP